MDFFFIFFYSRLAARSRNKYWSSLVEVPSLSLLSAACPVTVPAAAGAPVKDFPSHDMRFSFENKVRINKI